MRIAPPPPLNLCHGGVFEFCIRCSWPPSIGFPRFSGNFPGVFLPLVNLCCEKSGWDFQ